MPNVPLGRFDEVPWEAFQLAALRSSFWLFSILLFNRKWRRRKIWRGRSSSSCARGRCRQFHLIFLLDQGGGVFATHGTLFPPFSSHFFFSVSVSGVKAKKKNANNLFASSWGRHRVSGQMTITSGPGSTEGIISFLFLEFKTKMQKRTTTIRICHFEADHWRTGKKKKAGALYFFLFLFYLADDSIREGLSIAWKKCGRWRDAFTGNNDGYGNHSLIKESFIIDHPRPFSDAAADASRYVGDSSSPSSTSSSSSSSFCSGSWSGSSISYSRPFDRLPLSTITYVLLYLSARLSGSEWKKRISLNVLPFITAIPFFYFPLKTKWPIHLETRASCTESGAPRSISATQWNERKTPKMDPSTVTIFTLRNEQHLLPAFRENVLRFSRPAW